MGGGGQDVLAVLAYRAIEGRFDFAGASVIVVVMTVLQLSFFAVVRRMANRQYQ
jgi:ABC-type Fe3+ transport system permease subunit